MTSALAEGADGADGREVGTAVASGGGIGGAAVGEGATEVPDDAGPRPHDATAKPTASHNDSRLDKGALW